MRMPFDGILIQFFVMTFKNFIKILFSIITFELSIVYSNASIVIPIIKNNLVGAVTYSVYNEEGIGSWRQFPIISLDGGTTVSVSFDLLEPNQRQLSYRIRKMEYDWKEAKIPSSLYLNSFNSVDIETCYPSISTLVDYCTYQFDLNTKNSIGINKSGNYILSVFDKYEPDKTIFEFPFAVLDDKTTISISKSFYNDDKDFGKTQSLDIGVNINESLYNISNNSKVVILQNGLWENAVVLDKPSNIKINALEYRNQNSAVFDGGSQFYKLEHLGDRTYGIGIDHIYLDNNIYNVELIPKVNKKDMPYEFEPDQAGRQVVRSIDTNKDMDYHLVKFKFISEKIKDNDVVLSGECFRFIPDDFLKMKYNNQKGCYELGVLLKMGYQEYKYMTKDKDSYFLHSDKTMGDHYQTVNEYTVLVYYYNIQHNSYELIGYNSYKTK